MSINTSLVSLQGLEVQSSISAHRTNPSTELALLSFFSLDQHEVLRRYPAHTCEPDARECHVCTRVCSLPLTCGAYQKMKADHSTVMATTSFRLATGVVSKDTTTRRTAGKTAKVSRVSRGMGCSSVLVMRTASTSHTIESRFPLQDRVQYSSD